MTIIVEGGVNTLEVVEADLKAKRPVVLLQVCTGLCALEEFNGRKKLILEKRAHLRCVGLSDPVNHERQSGEEQVCIVHLCLRITRFAHVFRREPTDKEIEEHLDRFFPALKNDRDRRTRIGQIKKIMAVPDRYLLHVYELAGERNISETIFQAIFSGTASHLHR